MTDIQSLRHNTYLSTSRRADLGAYGSSPEDVALSTSPSDYARLRPGPRKSLASFASYLSTHRVATGSKSDWPSIDWSKLNDKDDVYRPDPDSMCATLQQHVLNNPSNDLPAQYNGFILHVLEAYHGLKGEIKNLEKKLHAEEQCHQVHVDELSQMIQSLSTANHSDLLRDAELRFSDPAGNRSVRLYDERKLGNRMESLLSKLDTGFSRNLKSRERRQTSQDSTGNSTAHSQPELLRSLSQLNGNGSLVASGSNHIFPLQSTFTSVTRLGDHSASSTESESSSDEEDPMTLASIALAAADFSTKGRLHAQQFEPLKQRQPKVALSAAADNESSLNGAQWAIRLSKAGNVPPGPTFNSKGSAGPSGFRRLNNKALEDDSYLPDETGPSRVHRRGFSFLPGDDFSIRPVKSLVIQQTASPNMVCIPLAGREHVESEGDRSKSSSFGSRRTLETASASGAYRQPCKTVDYLTEQKELASLPRRESSSNSLLTAIREGSSQSSPHSHPGSFGSSDGSVCLTGDRKPLRQNPFAVAAARAAKHRGQSEGNLITMNG